MDSVMPSPFSGFSSLSLSLWLHYVKFWETKKNSHVKLFKNFRRFQSVSYSALHAGWWTNVNYLDFYLLIFKMCAGNHISLSYVVISRFLSDSASWIHSYCFVDNSVEIDGIFSPLKSMILATCSFWFPPVDSIRYLNWKAVASWAQEIDSDWIFCTILF